MTASDSIRNLLHRKGGGRAVYCLILAYNEEKNIGGVIEGIFERASGIAEVVVVNDGSTDGTGRTLLDLKARYPVTVLEHGTNRGVAGAFRTAIAYAAANASPGDAAVIMEADGTSDPALVPDLVAGIDSGSDVVIASRFHRGGGYRGFPALRLCYSLCANALMRFLFPVPGARDYTIFYRAYRAGVLQKALEHYGDSFIEGKTFAVNAEILVKLHRLGGVKVSEVPLVYDYAKKKSRSSLRTFETLCGYLGFMAAALRRPGSRRRNEEKRNP